ncbi:MAG: sn-glycerol-3-phosphate ABC transporter ATP-binding protein UgpC [Bacilli bacterium]|nr:sn-glycerol-3-phosphate ABC transporter ATP-binding protein UgpC [Bacilli bacterium]MDY6430563.1 sn-glycerol-3-phosphate ABC transporter ATP-binding protein UgpC [Bacilli bacterium]
MEKEVKVEEVKVEEVADAKEKDVAKQLDYVSLRHVDKIYDNNVQAVFDFNLDIAKHEFIVFVGPSGCGKSTTLRMIAGLEDISRGELWIDGEYSNDRTPKDRDIAMVFQSYALYPHMTVYNNMAFGLKIRHLPKEEIDRRVREAAKILQIEEYLDRKPKALSGGQRQRVALGRAIVRNAKVFLMDEPLSNLDAKLRVQMRSEIIKLHEALGATTIYVTHDQTEAMTMASRIVVMKLGRIQQIGSPIDIYNNPANLFVATFIGSPAMNVMKARYAGGEIILATGEKIKLDPKVAKAHDEFFKDKVAKEEAELAELEAEQKGAGKEELGAKVEALKVQIEKDKAALKEEHDVVFGIRPEDIHEASDLRAADTFQIKVAVAELLGHEYYIHTDFGGVDLVAKIPLTREIKIGDQMKVHFNLDKAHIFDAYSENRIY